MQHIPFPASRRGLLLTSLIFSSPLLPGAESADKPDAIAAGENASQPAKSTRTTAGKSVAPTELPKLVVTDSRLEEPGYATPVVQSATKTSNKYVHLTGTLNVNGQSKQTQLLFIACISLQKIF